MTTLADFRTLVLAYLDDPSITRYTAAQVDVALRMSLQAYSQYRPLTRTYSADTDGERVISLPADFIPGGIYKVELVAADPDDNVDLSFYAYKHDEQISIEIPGRIIPAGEVLTVYYRTDHTIDGLDSASGTTITDADDEIVAMGAAGYASMTRANSRSESINMSPNVAQQLRALADNYLFRFNLALANVGSTFATLPAPPRDEY